MSILITFNYLVNLIERVHMFVDIYVCLYIVRLDTLYCRFVKTNNYILIDIFVCFVYYCYLHICIEAIHIHISITLE